MAGQGTEMTFREYYGDPFIEDLNAFRTWATVSQVSHQEDIDGVFAVQPNLIREHAKELAAWGQDRLVLFATALFFTVLVDQVCYTHFRTKLCILPATHPVSKATRLVPRGLSESPSFSDILNWIADCLQTTRKDMYRAYAATIRDAIPVMKEEVLEFFRCHLTAVDPTTFWATVSASSRRISRNEAGGSDKRRRSRPNIYYMSLSSERPYRSA